MLLGHEIGFTASLKKFSRGTLVLLSLIANAMISSIRKSSHCTLEKVALKTYFNQGKLQFFKQAAMSFGEFQDKEQNFGFLKENFRTS